MLRLFTLGGCFLERNGARLDSISPNRKGLALLALVAAAGDRGVARDSVVALLWPESDDERARTSLRQLVHSLRNQLNEPDLLLPSPELRLNPAVIESDVAQFRTAVQSHDYETAVASYRGPFLDGFFLKDNEDFERWVASERASLAGAAAQALEKLASDAERRGEPARAVAYWRSLAQAEPHSARAAIGLMRALDATGERAAALQHARVYELMMREEFGDVPDSAVVALAGELRNAPARAVAPSAAPPEPLAPASVAEPEPMPPRPRRLGHFAGVVLLLLVAAFLLARLAGGGGAPPANSIVVLPLANTSGDPDDEIFADGLSENLIASLARVSDLRVIARTSAFAFKTRQIDLRAIADSLGVGTVLDGSVQRVGNDLKVNVQLVNAADATVLWASTFDRELKDILVVQDEITSAVVEALSARLRAGGPEDINRRVIKDAEAYEMYLRGRYILTGSTDRESTARAQRYFQQALQRDPTLAHAHAGLSDVYTRLGIFGFAPPQQAYAAGKAAALRALELDDQLGEAYASLGHLKCVAEFDWTGAIRDFERSVTLSPNYTFARMPPPPDKSPPAESSIMTNANTATNS